MTIFWIVSASIAVILILITVIANRIPSSGERGGNKDETSQPSAKKTKKKLWPIIAVILSGLFVWVGIGKKNAIPIQQAAIEFHLKVGEETPTVEVGLGTHHRLWANKPYLAVSVQHNGSRISYPMPTGWETWNGDEPGGRLRLIGEEDNTVVKIVKAK